MTVVVAVVIVAVVAVVVLKLRKSSPKGDVRVTPVRPGSNEQK